MSQYDDKELEAMLLCVEAIKNLPEDSRKRVIEYLLRRWNLTVL